ncbi:MAG: NADPH-dependent assimilatory sulfite reductase hemoprotein subunit [Acetobacteraceae bacterium]|nr:NADPH-dependent assimilatory sulfite reductase hemoprotein subunit [Acetobacteraceae bacterium]
MGKSSSNPVKNGAPKRSAVEVLKEGSQFLRGMLADELAGPGTQVSEDGYNLLKFHGSYEQYDRDTATARKQRGEEKEYQFMVRVRMPGGRLTAAQYLALDELADRYGNGTLRLTTRQGIQFHGVIKQNLKPTIAAINRTLLTTQSACGDVVRNVMTSPAPVRDPVHARLEADARLLSSGLLPRSRAYHEIFLDGERLNEPDSEPLYGPTYLPRKFKIALGIPDDNTVDVLANDLGFLLVFEGERLIGYNVAVGGGLGMTHNRPDTYPRLATIIGSVGPDDLLRAATAVIGFQRDYGNRTDRKRARLKYVLDDLGVEAVRAHLARDYDLPLAPALPMQPIAVPDLLGWHPQGDGGYWLGVPVPSGRVKDEDGVALRSALRRVVAEIGANPIVTPQQDLLLADIPEARRREVDAILAASGVTRAEDLSPLQRFALACPALPTCGLALTEAERVREPIVAGLQAALDTLGLGQERISLRITGCPNGCARSYAGDIGLVGRIPGHFAIYVGGDFEGTVLAQQLLNRVKQADIAQALTPLLVAWGHERRDGEGFGDWARRTGMEALTSLIAPSGKAA